MAALAKNLGLKIDEPSYKKAGFLLRTWGYVPWDMPTLATALLHCKNEDDVRLIEYYYSDEAKAAIDEASRIKAAYFAQFPNIQVFIKKCITVAKQRGWVKTWVGRRRHFKKPKEEGYKAPNAVIQGGCGDIIKKKMADIDIMLEAYKSRSINNIHDALLFEIHISEYHLIPVIADMLTDLTFSVPMGCSAEMSGKSWADMKEVDITQWRI